MAEKKNDNKIMAMLERTGVIRKADAGEYPNGSSDIKPLFNTPDDVKVTPAAKQPIPGMPTPVFPSDKPSDASIEQAQADERIIEEFTASEAVETSAYEPEIYEEEPAQPPYEHSLPVESAPVPSQSAAAPPPWTPAPYTPPAPEREPTPENYTDRYLNTEELYDALAMRSKKTDSIYLIEDYLDTLPGSLPDVQRRDIVNKLIAASGFDYDLLMGDGVLRVKLLKEYAERFARHTDDYIAARQAEIDELDKQILRSRKLIENRRDLHKKQFFSIEAEAQRLKDILTFISG